MVQKWVKPGSAEPLWDQSFVFRIDRYSVCTGWINI